MDTKMIQAFFFAGVLMFIIWIFLFGRKQNIKYYINDIQKGYTGSVVRIYYKRGTHLKIRTVEEDSLDVSGLSSSLLRDVKVGDSIIKVANENYVFLIRDYKESKLPYLYISNRIRSSDEWPKEWRDKWLESSE